MDRREGWRTVPSRPVVVVVFVVVVVVVDIVVVVIVAPRTKQNTRARAQSDSFVRTQFARIRSGTSVSGFQKYKGGQEPSFEAMGMALGKRNYNKFYNANVKSESSEALKNDELAVTASLWRASARPRQLRNRRRPAI